MTDLYSALSRLVKALDPANGEVPPESECKAAFLQAKEVLEQHSNNGWQQIETAPRSTTQKRERLLLLVKGAGIQFGYVYDNLQGGLFFLIEHYDGDWEATGWMALPEVKK